MRTKKEVTIQDAANMLAFRSENRGFIGFGFAVLYCGVATWCVVTFAQTIQPGAPYPVGMKQLEYVDPSQRTATWRLRCSNAGEDRRQNS